MVLVTYFVISVPSSGQFWGNIHTVPSVINNKTDLTQVKRQNINNLKFGMSEVNISKVFNYNNFT
jgi:hypothetical protein